MAEHSSDPCGSGLPAPTATRWEKVRSSGLCPADSEALRRFLAEGSSTAFAALAERYAGLVYGVAMRRVGQHELAQEVTQDVFCILARKASAVLQKPVPLSAWLHRAAVLQSSQAARRESTRQRAMKSLATQHELAAPADGAVCLESLAAEIDEALDQLPPSDRELLLARHFERCSYGDLAARTGRTEAALMQHHHRALERLSRLFQRRGHRLTVAGLAGGLGAPFASAAPPGLAAACATNAIASAAAGASLSNGLVLASGLHSQLPFALLTAAVCLLAGASGFVASQRWLAGDRSHAASESQAMAVHSLPVSLDGSSAGAGLPPSLPWTVPTAADVIASEGHERLEKLALWLPGSSPADMREMLVKLSAMEESTTTRAEKELIMQRWVDVDREGAFAASRLVEGNTWMACRAWGRLHPEQAWAAMKSMDSVERSYLMRGIAEADPFLARDLLVAPGNQDPEFAYASVEDDVAKALAKKDPRLALDFAWKNGLSSVLAVVSEWVRTDPDAAIAHVSGLTSLRQRTEAVPALALALSEHHPERVKTMIEGLPDGRLKWQAMTDHVRALASSDEAAALSYARQATSPMARAAMAEQLAFSWAKTRPADALSLLRELDWRLSGDAYRLPDVVTPDATDVPLGSTKASLALTKLAGGGLLDDALSVAHDVPPGPRRDQALDAIASGWPADRVYELSEWIAVQETPSVRDTGTRTLIRHLMEEKEPDFEAAARWAATLSEPAADAPSPLLDVMRKWRGADPAAAAAALDRLSVSDAFRDAVMATNAR